MDFGESQASGAIERSKDREIEREDADKRVTLGGDAPKYVSLDETILGADRAAGPASSDLRGNSEGISDDGSGQ